MPRSYASFLVRCWQLSGGQQRFDVQHVQSGTHLRVDTLEAATAWMDELLDQESRRAHTAARRHGLAALQRPEEGVMSA